MLPISARLPALVLPFLLTACATVAPTTARVAAPATASQPAATSTATAPATEPGLITPLALTLADNGKTVNLANHKSITVTLTGNATTGYRWDVSKLEGAAVEKVGDVQYVPFNAPAGMVGTPGTFVATFKPIAPGKATINMTYARSWENGVPPAQTFSVTVVVDKVP